MSAIDGGCKRCGHPEGYIQEGELHVGLYCSACGAWQRWVSKRDAGVEPRSLASRPSIQPSKRSRVLERFGHRCALCGFGPPDVRLVIGHIISVRDGRELELSDAVIFDDWNLCALCEECNAGIGERSLHLPDALRAYHRWKLSERRKAS